MTRTLLNGPLVTELRLTEGLSMRVLARHLGTSVTTIQGIELGTNHESLTLGFVSHLADLLGTSVPALMSRPRTPALPRGDEQVVLAAVARREASIRAAELALALEWPLPRVKQAIRNLRASLVGSGLTLTDGGWDCVRLRSDDAFLSSAARRRILSVVARRELNLPAATVLYDVMTGDVGERWLRHATEHSRRVLGSLAGQGLVEVGDEVAQLSEFATRSLGPPDISDAPNAR